MAGGAWGEMPDLPGTATAGGPRRPNGLYVIRFRNTKREKYAKFLRGYGFQGGSHHQLQLEAPRASARRSRRASSTP